MSLGDIKLGSALLLREHSSKTCPSEIYPMVWTTIFCSFVDELSLPLHKRCPRTPRRRKRNATSTLRSPSLIKCWSTGSGFKKSLICRECLLARHQKGKSMIHRPKQKMTLWGLNHGCTVWSSIVARHMIRCCRPSGDTSSGLRTLMRRVARSFFAATLCDLYIPIIIVIINWLNCKYFH